MSKDLYEGGSTSSKRRKKRFSMPRSPWQQLNEQTATESWATRDIHGSQVLERGTVEPMKTRTLPEVGAVVIGVVIFMLLWLLWGGVGYAFQELGKRDMGLNNGPDEVTISQELGVREYWATYEVPVGTSPLTETCYGPVDEVGNAIGDECFRSIGALERPQWHIDATHEAMVAAGIAPEVEEDDAGASLAGWLLFSRISALRLLATLGIGVLVWLIARTALLRHMAVRNLELDNRDIDAGYDGDQRIALPQEVVTKYSIFPDLGATSPVTVSSMISHAMLSNSGVKKVTVPVRHDADVVDEKGNIVFYKGEIKEGEFEEVPMFDEKFAHKLFDASGVPNEKSLRKFFNPAKVEHNPGGKYFGKIGKQNTLAEHINEMWELPDYEPQRPAGGYVVDIRPVNTMVLAMTRAGKGQTYIEPVIDMWTREKRPNNIVINDPKGELLVGFYVRAAVRGFQPVQFNLINPDNTDVYNPLAMAAQAAREGDLNKCAAYVENIADVFFPVDGADDPVWPNAANNAFKRTAYGIIDFYLEEERRMRRHAQKVGTQPKVLETNIDKMWGKVTLYNCYQLFVQLSAKKLKDPVVQITEDVKAGKYGDIETDQTAKEKLEADLEVAKSKQPIWEGNPELDMLTLFFNATDKLPTNSVRTLVSNADKSLRAMGAAEKMLASVYGIAITAMSFFTDPTISTLTSGTLSQNTDLASLSFPRRFGVRFNMDYLAQRHLSGARAMWMSYYDPEFTKPMGDEFAHEHTVTREGWARYLFEGIYDQDVAYVKLELLGNPTGTLLGSFYFRFTKSYQTNLSGRRLVQDEVTGKKIARGGVLEEMVKNDDGTFELGTTTFEQEKLDLSSMTMADFSSMSDEKASPKPTRVPAIWQAQASYADQPKIIFLVTPPHLTKYAKLLLILIKQLVDLNFDQSYSTKPSQKPLYKTRYMLDELGNLQSDGHGIAGFETMLSIGLGQEQQFTLIMQTLQQLKDVYGDSVDKIVQGNTANIIFLKSTDNTMIDELSKGSGTRHVARRDSKTLSKDVNKMVKAAAMDSKVSYTTSMKEEPLISYNDLAYLPERNAIVFVAGEPPVWSRNEMILPMSWKLFSNTISMPGRKFSFQTVPTLSSASDFDVRLNQPNFVAMLAERMDQAAEAPTAVDIHRKAYGLTEFKISQLDPDVYAQDIMDIVDTIIMMKKGVKAAEEEQSAAIDNRDVFEHEIFGDDDEDEDGYGYNSVESYASAAEILEAHASVNEDVVAETQRVEAELAEHERKRYAEGWVSRDMLVDNATRSAIATLDKELAMAYLESRNSFAADPGYQVDEAGSLYDANGVLLMKMESTADVGAAAELVADEDSPVHSEGGDAVDIDALGALGRVRPTAAFKKHLVAQEDWLHIADGVFDREMAHAMVLTT